MGSKKPTKKIKNDPYITTFKFRILDDNFQRIITKLRSGLDIRPESMTEQKRGEIEDLLLQTSPTGEEVKKYKQSFHCFLVKTLGTLMSSHGISMDLLPSVMHYLFFNNVDSAITSRKFSLEISGFDRKLVSLGNGILVKLNINHKLTPADWSQIKKQVDRVCERYLPDHRKIKLSSMNIDDAISVLNKMKERGVFVTPKSYGSLQWAYEDYKAGKMTKWQWNEYKASNKGDFKIKQATRKRVNSKSIAKKLGMSSDNLRQIHSRITKEIKRVKKV